MTATHFVRQTADFKVRIYDAFFALRRAVLIAVEAEEVGVEEVHVLL